jgi:hypothetical protein
VRNTETQRIRTATKFVRSSVGHSESALRSSVTKTSQLIVLQPSRSALTMTGETLALSITIEKYTVVCFPHFLPACLVFVLFELSSRLLGRNSLDFFFKSHGSEIQSVQFVFPNGCDFGVAK